MHKRIDIMLLYRIARCYYVDKLSQNQISVMENISRSQISRLLDKAQELGIVKVSVGIPKALSFTDLADAVKGALGLRDVVVASTPEKNSGVVDGGSIADAIATAATDYLPGALKGCKTVGLGWGHTLYSLSLQLPYFEAGGDRTYVPLIGQTGTENPSLQINNIVDRITERHRARCYYIVTSAVREKSAAFTALEQERIKMLKTYWSKLDAAVVGLGSKPQTGNMLRISEMSDTYVERLAESEAKGDILSQFFFEDGKVIEMDDEYQYIMFDITRLPRVKRVICLAGGEGKVEGILAAAAAKYFDTLITDSATAQALLDCLQKKGQL